MNRKILKYFKNAIIITELLSLFQLKFTYALNTYACITISTTYHYISTLAPYNLLIIFFYFFLFFYFFCKKRARHRKHFFFFFVLFVGTDNSLNFKYLTLKRNVKWNILSTHIYICMYVCMCMFKIYAF